MTDTHLGKQIWYAPAIPATNDATGFEALTWTRINGYGGGLQLGGEAANIDVPDLGDATTRGAKGMLSYNSSTGTFRAVTGDAGQSGIRTLAQSATSEGSLKVISADVSAAAVAGDVVQYAQGFWHSYNENEISGDNFEGFSVSFKQNAPHVNATEPV